jgi:predicted GNAT family acetyltransferase
MDLNNNDIEIIHSSRDCKFYCEFEGARCSAEYELVDERTIDLYRTFVDPSLRGKGVADELLRHVVDYAKKNEMKIKPSCSYAVKFFRRNSEYKEMLSDETDLNTEGSCRLPGAS